MSATTEQTPIDMVLAILKGSRDGDDLSPGDLYLTELAASTRLNERGMEKLVELHRQVTQGTYLRPWLWLHGIEHLTKDHQGYVYWKGARVEHYSFSNPESERKASLRLAQRCLAIEGVGLKPTSRTVLFADRFIAYGSGHRWLPVLAYSLYDCLEIGPDDSGVLAGCLVVHRRGARVDDAHLLAITMRTGDPQPVIEPVDVEWYTRGYRRSKHAAPKPKGGAERPTRAPNAQGGLVDHPEQWTTWVEGFGFTPDLVAAAIEADQAAMAQGNVPRHRA